MSQEYVIFLIYFKVIVCGLIHKNELNIILSMLIYSIFIIFYICIYYFDIITYGFADSHTLLTLKKIYIRFLDHMKVFTFVVLLLGCLSIIESQVDASVGCLSISESQADVSVGCISISESKESHMDMYRFPG